ncbi:MAG TPA: hypothetical protein VGA98_03350 [Allosphingosinicella sp.]|jgi:hypothetical protein
MSVYFFDVYDGPLACLDDEGTEHESCADVRAHAIDGIRSIVSDAVRAGAFSLSGRVQVRDTSGRLTMVVPFAEAVSQRE